MYQLLYHSLVLKADFPKISKSDKKRILTTLEKKLMNDPIAFGKPLIGELKGFYRLRIDPYRVVYKIEKQKVIVFILNIGLRKDMIVYMEAARRLKLFR